MRRLGQTGQIIAALSGALAGAVLGAVVQDVLVNDLRFLTAIVAALALGVIACTTTLIAVTRTSSQSLDRLLAANADSNAAMVTQFQTLASQFGLRVRSQMIRATNAYRSPDEDLVVQAFRGARRNIVALDLVTEGGVRPDVDMNRDVMKWHLDALLAKAAEGITYRRTCQVPSHQLDAPFAAIRRRVQGQVDDDEGGESVFAQHCLQMGEMKRAGHDVILKTAPVIYPYKFVIIDEAILILQLHEAEHGDDDVELDGPRTLCELVIDDPRKELIRHFQLMWRRVNDHPRTKSVIVRSDPDLSGLVGTGS